VCEGIRTPTEPFPTSILHRIPLYILFHDGTRRSTCCAPADALPKVTPYGWYGCVVHACIRRNEWSNGSPLASVVSTPTASMVLMSCTSERPCLRSTGVHLRRWYLTSSPSLFPWKVKKTRLSLVKSPLPLESPSVLMTKPS